MPIQRSPASIGHWLCILCGLSFGIGGAIEGQSEERTEHFDRDPNWEGRNHRATTPAPRRVRQDFGYSSTNHAGGSIGELGGTFNPDSRPAYYARKIDSRSFDQPMSVSGKLACTGRQFHILVGFFNTDTTNEWRTPNSIFLRLYGRGDVFYAYVEYATSRWRAGGDTPGGFALEPDPENGRTRLRGFKTQGAVHDWSLRYDPKGNNGLGSITAKIDDEISICHLEPEHRKDGATFTHCGVLSIPKSHDDAGEVWFDDFVIDGERESFDRDPQWDAQGNRATYETTGVRPRFDFGYSSTQFAGGLGKGELGGIVYRGDCRDRNKLASYADRTESLNLEQPLRASGRVSLHRGVSDSTTLLGFFHDEDSMAVSPSQSSGLPMNFLGIAVEGPSREGFLCYPCYRVAPDRGGYSYGDDLPYILPDGKSHEWSLQFEPSTVANSASQSGSMVMTLDGKTVRMNIASGPRNGPVRFNRFGIVTTWIDGNAQRVYFDDLTYTIRQ